MKHIAVQGWRSIGDMKYYFRSKMEANFGRWLDFQLRADLIQKWDHEPETFWFLEIKRGVRSYLPDFRVLHNDGSIIFYEVKGFYDSKSITKIKRFRKYYPNHTLRLIDKIWFKDNKDKLKMIIKDWE